jgi:hypothetical protein
MFVGSVHAISRFLAEEGAHLEVVAVALNLDLERDLRVGVVAFSGTQLDLLPRRRGALHVTRGRNVDSSLRDRWFS